MALIHPATTPHSAWNGHSNKKTHDGIFLFLSRATRKEKSPSSKCAMGYWPTNSLPCKDEENPEWEAAIQGQRKMKDVPEPVTVRNSYAFPSSSMSDREGMRKITRDEQIYCTDSAGTRRRKPKKKSMAFCSMLRQALTFQCFERIFFSFYKERTVIKLGRNWFVTDCQEMSPTIFLWKKMK